MTPYSAHICSYICVWEYMPTDFLSLVRRQIFVTDIRCSVAGRNRIFKYVACSQACCFAMRVKTLCKHMHCARVMRCKALYFGINTILATVFHPEKGRQHVLPRWHISANIQCATFPNSAIFMHAAVGYSVWLFVSDHFCPTWWPCHWRFPVLCAA